MERHRFIKKEMWELGTKQWGLHDYGGRCLTCPCRLYRIRQFRV